jgi:hypothetical protein
MEWILVQQQEMHFSNSVTLDTQPERVSKLMLAESMWKYRQSY